VAIVVAGTAVDIFLWRTSSERHAKTAHLMETIATSTAFANATEMPRTASAASTVTRVGPLPGRSHSEVGGKTAKVDLTLDGIAAGRDKKKLDVANDLQSQVVEASATRSSQTAVKPKPKPKRDIRGKSTPKGSDDFRMDLRTTSARRPTTTIDKKDPYSP
jgi:hypothetical protein